MGAEKTKTRVGVQIGIGRKRKVLMTKSVGELAAGRRVKLHRDHADALILKGHADGELSRDYSDEERAAIRAASQTVVL